MKSLLPLGLVLLETSAAFAEKVVHIPLTRTRAEPGTTSLRRRANPVSVTLGNADVLYYANVTVGTPGQLLQLQVDTGSSDVWMTATAAQYCKQSRYNCQGGTFDTSKSTSFNSMSTTVFNISYVDGSGSSGHYFKDNFGIGGATMEGVQMGLATTTTIGTGIIGTCFAADESVCSGVGSCQTYPSIMQNMVSQGLINSQAYSLWLDDANATSGSILFGGVDTTKFLGNLVTIPIQKDENSGTYTSFSVAFTGLSVTNSSGTRTLTASNYAEPAILDSGTSLTLLPNAVFRSISAGLSLEYSSQAQVYIAPCSASSTSTTYNFQFGGTGGPLIKVPSSEFFTPIQGYRTSTGAAACEFGILPAGNVPTLFGDTFLRSAYVVYDLDNKEISMAQTNFDATGSNVQAIQAGTSGVPDVSGTANGVSVAQTGTASASYGVLSATVSGTSTATTGAAAALKMPTADITGVVVLAMGSTFALLGSCLIFL